MLNFGLLSSVTCLFFHHIRTPPTRGTAPAMAAWALACCDLPTTPAEVPLDFAREFSAVIHVIAAICSAPAGTVYDKYSISVPTRSVTSTKVDKPEVSVVFRFRPAAKRYVVSQVAVVSPVIVQETWASSPGCTCFEPSCR
jgi:hypothetical protein